MTLLSHADYERIAANLSYPTEAFIGGTFAPALSGETMPTVNPATGKVVPMFVSDYVLMGYSLYSIRQNLWPVAEVRVIAVKRTLVP